MFSRLLKRFLLFWFWIFFLPNILQKVLEHFLHSSSHLIMVQISAPFDCLCFPWCNFFKKWFKFWFEIFLQSSYSLFKTRDLIFSCKVLFLEIGWCNFQAKFFSVGFCIFQLATCGEEVIFHILNWKSNFLQVRRK